MFYRVAMCWFRVNWLIEFGVVMPGLLYFALLLAYFCGGCQDHRVDSMLCFGLQFMSSPSARYQLDTSFLMKLVASQLLDTVTIHGSHGFCHYTANTWS